MGLLHKEQRSLFGEILDWMLTPLLLLWPVSLALSWLVAQNIADKPFDRALVANAQALAQLVRVQQGQPMLALTPQTADLLHANGSDQVFFQVTAADGRLLGGARHFADPPPAAAAQPLGQPVLRDDTVRDPSGQSLEVRVATLQVLADESSLGMDTPASERAPRRVVVQVAETRDKRSLLAAEIIKGVMVPQFLILPITVLLIWLALSRAIRPLAALEERIRARKSDDLSPLDAQAVPIEVAPLVDSVNILMQRQTAVAANQKRFLADAAHQLKTPLAGLRMQADLAQRSDASAEDLKRSLQQIGHSSVRATHSVNQLLAMSRAESGTMPRQPCNLPLLVQEVVQDCLQRALDKHIDLGYEGVDPQDAGVWVQGNPILLQEMVRNLLDNAIHYTPAWRDGVQGMVTAHVLTDPYGRVLIVQVEDNGYGIAPAEREQVFKPFYRTLGTEADGSGLGLPIVQEIARQHGARVVLDAAHPRQPLRKGALFSIRFAALADAPEPEPEPV